MNRRPPWSPHGSLSPRKHAYLSPRLGQHQRGSHKSTYRRCSPLMTIRYSATPLLTELYHLLSFDPDPRHRGPVLCTPVTTAASRSTGAAHQPCTSALLSAERAHTSRIRWVQACCRRWPRIRRDGSRSRARSRFLLYPGGIDSTTPDAAPSGPTRSSGSKSRQYCRMPRRARRFYEDILGLKQG